MNKTAAELLLENQALRLQYCDILQQLRDCEQKCERIERTLEQQNAKWVEIMLKYDIPMKGFSDNAKKTMTSAKRISLNRINEVSAISIGPHVHTEIGTLEQTHLQILPG